MQVTLYPRQRYGIARAENMYGPMATDSNKRLRMLLGECSTIVGPRPRIASTNAISPATLIRGRGGEGREGKGGREGREGKRGGGERRGGHALMWH